MACRLPLYTVVHHSQLQDIIICIVVPFLYRCGVITNQPNDVFCNVEVLIFVFDVESREPDRDFQYYQSCLKRIHNGSPNAKVFCLIHKMDLVPEDQRKMVSNLGHNIINCTQCSPFICQTLVQCGCGQDLSNWLFLYFYTMLRMHCG